MEIFADVTKATLETKFDTVLDVELAQDAVFALLNDCASGYVPGGASDGNDHSLVLSGIADFKTASGSMIEFYHCPIVGSMKLNGIVILLALNGDRVTLQKDWGNWEH